MTEAKFQKILIYLLILLGSYCFVSCTRIQYVPVESVRTEYRDIHTRDSIHVKDSVFLLLKGDTVYLERYKTVFHDRFLRDSVFLQDTIRVPYPVEKIVYQNKLKWYQRGLVYIGIGALLLMVVRRRV